MHLSLLHLPHPPQNHTSRKNSNLLLLKTHHRKLLSLIEKRLKLPGELPEPALKAEWIEVPPDEARICRLEDGSWEARVPGLEEGFHRVRLLVPQPGTKNFHGNDFVVEVGSIPRSAALKWVLGAAAGLLLFYLLRQRFRRSW